MMSLVFIKAPLCTLTAISIALLPACGGGDSTAPASTSLNAPAATVPPPAVAPIINTVILADGDPSKPKAIVNLPDGDSVSYFTSTAGGTLTEALVKSAGKSSWVYYNTDGSINRILDLDTGSYVVIRARQDVIGSEYLNFDNANTFVSGVAVYQEAGVWYSAPILGDMGQITASLNTTAAPATGMAPAVNAFSGAVALRAAQLAYGTPVALSTGAQAILNGQISTSSIGKNILNLLIPSAYAQSFTSEDRARLYSAASLAVVGGVVYAGAPLIGTLFLAAGAVKAYSSLVNLQGTNLSAAFDTADRILENSTSASYAETDNTVKSGGLLDRLRTSITSAVGSSLNSIRTSTRRTVNLINSLPAGVTAAARLVDPTPSSQVLPAQPLRSTSLTGSIVDSAGRVFAATGSVSNSGALVVTANAPDGEKIEVTGSVVNNASGTVGTVTGQVTRNVAGQTVTGALSSGTTASVGKCETLTQSGGQGTFSYAFNLGRASGQFSLSYQMYGIPDSMTVVVGGQTVFTTGGLVSGTRNVSANYSGSDTAFVNMSAPNSGTAWDFTLGCGS